MIKKGGILFMKIDMNNLSVREQLRFEHEFEFFTKWLEAIHEYDNCYYFDDLKNLSSSEHFRLMNLLDKFDLKIEDDE